MSGPHKQSSRRGSVLAAMLGLIAFLSALLISFMSEATERIKYNGLIDERGGIREVAFSALEVTLAAISEVAELNDGLRGPSEGWWDPLGYAGIDFSQEGYRVTVKVEDESAKLPLAHLDDITLRLLFDEMDVSSRDAERLANTLLDWMDGNELARIDSMDGDDYEDRDPPYQAANSVPTSWEEFGLIDGYKELFWDEAGKPTEYLNLFKSAVSLYNTGNVNINNASSLVLEVLARVGGFDPDDLDDILAGDDNIRGTVDDEILTSADELGATQAVSLADFSSKLLRVMVTVEFGDASYRVEALVNWKGSGAAQAEPANAVDVMNDPYKLFPANPQTALGYPYEVVRLAEGATL